MASFNVYDGGTWRKAKNVWVFDGSSWRQAKGAWVFDGGSWRKGYTSEKTASIRITFNMAEYHHEDGWVGWGTAKQGYYGNMNSERSGYWYNPNGAADIRGCMPGDFESLVRVDRATLAINRGGSGDWGSTRTMRMKMTTKTGVPGHPDAVNGYWDCGVSGGQGWKYEMTSSTYLTVLTQCINQTGGARNVFMNSDDHNSWGSGNWSYHYLSVTGAFTDIGITYRPR